MSTAHPEVEQALAQVADLAGRPLEEHPEVIERAHRMLQEALASLDGQ